MTSSASSPLASYASLSTATTYRTIPTPVDVVYAQADNLARTALGLRVLIIAHLKTGRTVVDGMYSDAVVDLIKEEFRATGWDIINAGLQLRLKPIRSKALLGGFQEIDILEEDPKRTRDPDI